MITRLFPLSLTLQAPAQLSGPEPGTTLDFIPGSAVRGAVAAGLRAGGTAEEMQTLVLSGAVCYLNGYLQVEERRSLPAPLSLRTEPANGRLVDMSAVDDGDRREGALLPLDPLFIVPAGDGVRLVEPERRRRAHRMVGADGRDGDGGPAPVEALAAGQRFGALLAVTAADEAACEALRQRVSTALGPVLSVGRSRRVEYGGQARISWGSPAERECDAGNGALDRDLDVGDTVRLLLTADYLGRRADTGQIDPLAIADEVVAALDGRVVVQVEQSRWGTRLAGGYSRTWGLPLPGGLALRAGSVLVLRAVAAVALADLLALEAAGFGERREAGYGRAAFLRPGTREVARASERSGAARPRLAPPSRPPGELIARMEARLLDAAVEAEIGRVAAEAARGVAVRTLPAAAVLRRLNGLVARPPVEALETLFAWTGERVPAEGIRPEERAALERCTIRLFGRRSSLLRLLHTLSDPRSDAPEGWLRLEALAAHRHIVSVDQARGRLLAPERRPVLRVQLAAALIDALTRRAATTIRTAPSTGAGEAEQEEAHEEEAHEEEAPSTEAARDLDEHEGTDGDDE